MVIISSLSERQAAARVELGPNRDNSNFEASMCKFIGGKEFHGSGLFVVFIR